MSENKHSISVHPEELKFDFELEKQCHCDLKVMNNSEHHVAFKVKTTSPKKYFVRPNTGVIQPWDSFVIRVTLQSQHEYPPDMLCKDKFLLQCAVVSPSTVLDEIPQDTFDKENGMAVEELKLRVVYSSPPAHTNSEDELLTGSKSNPDASFNQTLQHLKIDRDSAVRRTQQLQQELEMLKRRRCRKVEAGFSFKFALFVGLIGIMLGFLLNLSLTSPTV